MKGGSGCPARNDANGLMKMRGSRDQQAEDERATTRLYLITPPALDPDRFARELEEALAGGDVACLQLRLKDTDDDAVRRATRVLKPIAQDRRVACTQFRTCPSGSP